MKLLLRILAAPIMLLISLFVWLCTGIISCTMFVFQLLGALLSILGVVVLVTNSIKNGLILLVMAVIVSPMGLPMLAVWLLGKIQAIQYHLQTKLYG